MNRLKLILALSLALLLGTRIGYYPTGVYLAYGSTEYGDCNLIGFELRPTLGAFGPWQDDFDC